MYSGVIVIALVTVCSVVTGFLCFMIGVELGAYKLHKQIQKTRTLPDDGINDDINPPDNVIKMRPRRK